MEAKGLAVPSLVTMLQMNYLGHVNFLYNSRPDK